MRYSNTVTEEDPQGDVNEDYKWLNQKNEQQDTVSNVFLPAFTNPVSAMHRDRLKGKGNARNRKAGFSDKILIWRAVIGSSSNRLVFEAKTFWSFDDNKMDRLVSATTAACGSGVVCSTVSEANDILTQVSHQYLIYVPSLTTIKIWGECHFLDVDFGMITNGSTLRVFIKTGENQLCFSGVRNWNDDDVFTAMLGLSFIAIDHPKGDNEKIKNYLCNPITDRKCDWPQGPPQVQEKPEPRSSPEVSCESGTPYSPSDSEAESESDDDYTGKGKRPKKAKAKKVQVVAPTDTQNDKRPVRRTAETKAQATVDTKPKTTVKSKANTNPNTTAKPKAPAKLNTTTNPKNTINPNTTMETKPKSTMEAKPQTRRATVEAKTKANPKTAVEPKEKTPVETKTKTASKTAPKSAAKAPSNRKPKAGPSTGRRRG